MLKSFSEIAKIIKEKRRAEGLRRDGEGRAIAELSVRDDSEFLSPYSVGTHEVIDGEVAEFIENVLQPIPYREHLCLRIYSNAIDEQERIRYTQAIQTYYGDRYESSVYEKKKLRLISLIMGLIGVAALAAMILLNVFTEHEILAEVIDIFAWVFVWEAVDIAFLQCTLIGMKQKRYLALVDSVIEFYHRGEE